MKRKLLVLEPTFGFDGLARERGFDVVLGAQVENNPETAKGLDAVVFMGGIDISPTIYGQSPTKYSNHHNKIRDDREIAFYNKFKHLPKLGICRGAQLLNCLNGGFLYQHVFGHEHGHHPVVDIHGKEHVVCSIHHQMMALPVEGAKLISWKVGDKSELRFNGTELINSDGIDPEVVFFPDDKALAFQAHPEFGPDTCTDYFFDLVDEYIF